MIRNNKKGVTLLELMVVVGIIGIVATLAIPNYLKMLPHLRLKSAARDVASAMQHARMTAIAKNASQDLSFDSANDSFSYGSVSSNDWMDVDIYEQTGGEAIGAPSLPSFTVTFKSDGTTSITSGYKALYLRNKSDINKKYRVKVGSIGTVKVEELASGGWAE